MTGKTIPLTLALFLYPVFGFPSFGHAEYRCRAVVSYQWQPKEEEEPRTEDWTTVVVTAATEPEARARIEESLERNRERALEACRRTHQDVAGCISTKFAAQSSILGQLTFSARKALEEAIIADCRMTQGLCGAVTHSEPVCSSLAELKGQGEEGGAATRKGKGK